MRHFKICLKRGEGGVRSLLLLLAAENRIRKTVSPLGLSSFGKAREGLTDNCFQLRPNLVRSRPFQGDELRDRRGLGRVVVKERGGSLVELVQPESEGLLPWNAW